MLKKKHVLFRTNASIDEAKRLLQSKTLPGSPSADNLPAMMKDTFSGDATPFRGEVNGNRFKVTRRRRGRNVRIQLEGTLEEKPDGSTEIRASMSPPPTLMISLVGGLINLMIMSGFMAVNQGPHWLAMLLTIFPVVAIASRLYEAETSRTFSALRDAIPEKVLPAVAPIAATESERAQVASTQVGSQGG